MASTKVPSELIADLAITGDKLHTALGNTGVTANSSGLHIGQDVATSATVQFQTVTGSHAGTIAAATTGTTQANTDNSAKMATTEFVTNKIQELIGGAPSTLNDLNELAAAINDDASYNSTLTTALATKAPIASPTFTGTGRMNGDWVVGAATGEDKFVVAPQAAGSGTFLISYNDAGNAYEPLTADFETLALRTSGTPRLSIDSSGNIALAGNLTTTGTIDGVDIATRDAVLTSTTTTATAALPKAGGSLTGALGISDSLLISYSGNDGGGRDAGLKIQNDASDWGAYIRKASAAQYGMRIDSAGSLALAIYGSEGGADLNFSVNGSNGNVLSTGDIGMATGHSSGKFAVMSTSVHGSYDFYNNGTSYFNGATIIDATLNIVSDSTDSYSPGSFLDYPTMTLKHPTGNGYYNGTRITNNNGSYEWFYGATQTSGNEADFVFQGYDRTGGAYKEMLRIQDSGNVGIGTNAPDTKLHVFKATAGAITNYTNNALVVENNTDVGISLLTPNASAGHLMFGSPGNQYHSYIRGAYGASTTSTLKFYTDGINTMTHAFGYVGIGTDDPTNKLDVVGSMRSQHNIVSNSQYTMLKIGSNRTVNDYGGLNKNYFTMSLATPGADTNGGSNAHAYGDLYFNLVDGSDATLHPKMILTYAGDLLINGDGSQENLNVLAGTPKIQIGNGQGHSSLQFYSKTDSVGALYFGDGNGGTNRYPGYIEYRHSNDTMAFRVDGEQRFQIEASGIEVSGGPATTTVSQIGFKNFADTAYLRSKYYDPSATTETYLAFHTNKSGAANGTVAEHMRLKGNRLGINQTNPVASLHVYNPDGGNATDKASMLSEAVMKLQPHVTNSTNMLFAQVDGGNAMGIQVTNGPATADWDLSLSPFGGRVGIGTVAPGHPLSVQAANAMIVAHSTADGQRIGFQAKYLDHSTLYGSFEYSTGDAQLYIDNHFTGNSGVYSDINFRNKDTSGAFHNRLKIKGSTGAVGIGTETPGAALEVVRGVESYCAIFGAPQGSGKAILFKDNHASPNKYNFLVGSQFNVNNAFEITPSTAVGGTTFSHPSIQVDAATGVVGFTAQGNTTTSQAVVSIGEASGVRAGVLNIRSTSGTAGGIRHRMAGGSQYLNVASTHTGSGTIPYWHIKTNIYYNQNIMFVARVHGYAYGGSGHIIDMSRSGYAYSGSSTGVIATQFVNNGTSSAAALDPYYTSAGQLCFRAFATTSSYYTGWAFDIKMQSPTGYNKDFVVDAHHMNNTSGNYYT